MYSAWGLYYTGNIPFLEVMLSVSDHFFKPSHFSVDLVVRNLGIFNIRTEERYIHSASVTISYSQMALFSKYLLTAYSIISIAHGG